MNFLLMCIALYVHKCQTCLTNPESPEKIPEVVWPPPQPPIWYDSDEEKFQIIHRSRMLPRSRSISETQKTGSYISTIFFRKIYFFGFIRNL